MFGHGPLWLKDHADIILSFSIVTSRFYEPYTSCSTISPLGDAKRDGPTDVDSGYGKSCNYEGDNNVGKISCRCLG